MNNITIIILLIIFGIIFLAKIWPMEKLEHLTQEGELAIQNVASLYSKDTLSLANLTTTNSTNLKNTRADNIQAGKLQLGNKWLFSGVGDAQANDDWLRLLKTDGSKDYYGGLAAGRLYDARIGDLLNVRNGLQSGIDSTNGRLNAITRTRGGQKCADGFDVGSVNVNNIDECYNYCSTIPSAMCAMSRSNDANDKRCLCKSFFGVWPDGNWNSRLIV